MNLCFLLLLSHGKRDVITDSTIDSVQPEAADQQKLLEGSEVVLVLHGERSLLWSIQVIPLQQKHKDIMGQTQ